MRLTSLIVSCLVTIAPFHSISAETKNKGYISPPRYGTNRGQPQTNHKVYEATYPFKANSNYLINVVTGFESNIILPKGVKVLSAFTDNVAGMLFEKSHACDAEKCTESNSYPVLILKLQSRDYNMNFITITTNKGMLQFYIINSNTTDSPVFMQKVTLSESATSPSIKPRTILHPKNSGNSNDINEVSIISNNPMMNEIVKSSIYFPAGSPSVLSQSINESDSND